jgi:hypothetical protein
MRILFLTTAAFAALVMIAPVGNAHAYALFTAAGFVAGALVGAVALSLVAVAITAAGPKQVSGEGR